MPSVWPAGRRGACTAAATAFTTAALILMSVALTAQPPPPVPPEAARNNEYSPPRSSGPHTTALPRSKPSAIEIRKIGLNAAIAEVGTSADGSIALPVDADHAGWYTGSPTPGENGNTIMVGHLDSSTGPAAFYGLGALRPGDRISLKRRDRSTAAFTVTDMAVWPKGAFPSRVFAPTLEPLLTLITCADWDKDTKDYRSNLVITARR